MLIVRNNIENRKNKNTQRKPRNKAELEKQNIGIFSFCFLYAFGDGVAYGEISVAGKVKTSLGIPLNKKQVEAEARNCQNQHSGKKDICRPHTDDFF